jgi:hypothetical protein
MAHCARREHLIAQYETALRIFSGAVRELTGKHSHEFQPAYDLSERLHVECDAARVALEKHTKEHGCGAAQTVIAS